MIARVTADGYPCFRQLSDIVDYNNKMKEIRGRLVDQLRAQLITQFNEAERLNRDLFNELLRLDHDLKTKFAAAGRLWDVPVRTEVKILKFYDQQGTEITPIWIAPQFYTSNGVSVLAAADWNGKTIYIMPGSFAGNDEKVANAGDDKKVASEPSPDSSPLKKAVFS